MRGLVFNSFEVGHAEIFIFNNGATTVRKGIESFRGSIRVVNWPFSQWSLFTKVVNRMI